MFRFLGEVNSNRKKGKAQKAEQREKNSGHSRVKPNHEKNQISDASKSSGRSGSQRQMQNLDKFFDSMSIEKESLYTSPSKRTVQYPYRGALTSSNIEWHSSEDSEDEEQATDFTAERALEQYRLGGWQSPQIIESSLTPSTTASTFCASPQPRSQRGEEAINYEDDFSYSEAFTDLRNKSPVFSPYLHSDDNDLLVSADEKDSKLEVYSTASSEISWNYDSRAFQKTTTSEGNSNQYKQMDAELPGENIEQMGTDPRSRRGDEEESVCSSVSSLSASRYMDNSYDTKISTWSPTISPPPFKHEINSLKNGRVSTNHCTRESMGTDSSMSQGSKYSRENESIHSKDDKLMISRCDDQMSFSELISLCEGESLAERLAPNPVPPGTRQFGRPIDMNCSDAGSGSSSSLPSKQHRKVAKSQCLENNYISALKEKNPSFVTPKASNTSMSLSNCDHMFPNAKVEADTVENTSIAEVSLDDSINFSSVLSKFEAQSLEYGMEPPTPRRLSKQTFEVITEIKKEKGILHSGDDDDLHQSEHEHRESEKSIFEQGNRSSFHEETSISSLHSCHEEVTNPIDSNRSDFSESGVSVGGALDNLKEDLLEDTSKDESLPPSQMNEDVSEPFEKSEVICVSGTEIPKQTEDPNIDFVEPHHPLDCPKSRDNGSATSGSNINENSITLSMSQPETNIKQTKSVEKINSESAINRQMTGESGVSKLDQYQCNGPVDLDELSLSDLRTEMRLQQIDFIIQDAAVHPLKKSESSALTNDEHSIDNLANLEESSMNRLKPETTSKQMEVMNPIETVRHEIANEADVSRRDQNLYDGPVDLDGISIDGISLSPETSSPYSHQSTSLSPENKYELPVFKHRGPQISSPVASILDKENRAPSICGDNEDEEVSKGLSQCDRGGTCRNEDKTVIDQSYEKAMKSIGTSKRGQVPRGRDSSGSLFLGEIELKRHEKLMEQIPSGNLMTSGYDDWKRKLEDERIYFKNLHEKVMAQKKEQEDSRSVSKELPRDKTTAPTLRNMRNSKPMTNDRKGSTRSEARRRGKTKGSKLFSLVFHPCGTKKGNGKKEKRRNTKEKKDNKGEKLSVTDVDQSMLLSRDKDNSAPDDFADMSLFPLSQLEDLTKRASHDRLQKKALEHLEWERKRQMFAEIDKEKDEWCQQIRTSILKEQELERQRRLNNANLASMVPQRTASPGLGFSNEQMSSTNQQNASQPGLKLSGVFDPHKLSQEGYLYYSTPINYLSDKSRITASTTKESESLENCSINSFLHTNLSFDSVQTASSMNTPKTASITLPCVVCKVADRTHISIPCMHYSFCSDCAEELHGLKTPSCPICDTEGIKLSRVYT